jgi:lipopolysaccharide/colanic/teichoic acid biosynthesis glycosyltransferase
MFRKLSPGRTTFISSCPNARLEDLGDMADVGRGLPDIYGRRCLSKRVFDTTVAFLSLCLSSPLWVLIAISIKLDSSGPIIFKQTRVGEHGRLFTMLKFRSMHADAAPNVHKAYAKRAIEQNLGPTQMGGHEHSLKMESDPHITRVGKLIRKTSLDELPQLLNVLRGEMSLVGPRPPLPYEVESYQEWHRRRLEVLPGITGWWQVKGRNQVPFDEMVRMDICYIAHMSLWTDIKILFLTPWAMVSGKGAG